MWRRCAYPLVFIVALGVLFFLPAWRAADWALFSALHNATVPRWSEEVSLVDVPYYERDGNSSLIGYRRRVAALMQHLAAGSQGTPRVVLFDIDFIEQSEGAEHLVRGLQALAQRGVRVYAARDPFEHQPSTANRAVLRHLHGVGHTAFGTRGGVLLYRAEITRRDNTTLTALPIRVTRDIFQLPEAALPETLAVRLGATDAARAHSARWGHGAGALVPLDASAAVALDQRFVIVGSFAADADRFDARSGPELLAWALLARLARSDAQVGPRVLDSPWLYAFLLIVVPGLSAVSFRAAYKRLAGRPRAPLFSSALAITAGIATLAGMVAALFALGHLYCQVTLPAIGVLIAVALASLAAFSRELLASLQADLESGRLQASETYDVFISYSREPRNAQWVEEQVFKPLLAARHSDGTPFKVFFDTRNLRLGDFWYRRLALAIAGSRYFVPVYSDDYFDKAFCMHEMTLALARSAQKANFILPLRRTQKPVPAGYEHIQHVDVGARPDFIDEIIAHCAR
jgi:TIR domain